jgi:hypothetical protein
MVKSWKFDTQEDEYGMIASSLVELTALDTLLQKI